MTHSQTAPSSRLPVWALVLIGVAILLVAGLVGGVVADAVDSDGSSSSAGSCVVTPVADENLPSVVTIYASGRVGSGIGSGEVIQSDGYILTNNHVVQPAVDGGTLEVRFNDGAMVPATLTGRDAQVDLAVVKVDETGLRPIPEGNSDNVVVGEPVIAMGSPLGLVGTVTSGIVSALDRTIEVAGEGDQSALLVDAVQTDASINPGNSGGALVNCSGQLVGVNSAGATVPSSSGEASPGSIGLNFAIPVNLAVQVSNELISTGHTTHSYFGMSVSPVRAGAGPNNGAPSGLQVVAVVPGGPAAQAGLQVGDIITSINGQPATSTDQIMSITLSQRAGDTVKIEYWRNGKTSTTTVTLGSVP
jgi:putative serine protease PepD